MKISTLNHGIAIRVLLIVALAAGMASLPGRTAQAAGQCTPGGVYTGVVTINSDSYAVGTLRGEIACSSSSTITFASSLAGQTITLTSGQISINRNITIDGSALGTPVTINGNGNGRIFYISTGPVTLDNLILRNGNVSIPGGSSQGGAIYNVVTLTLKHMTFTDNHTNAKSSEGGAIFNAGSGNLTVQTSTFTGNVATSSGVGDHSYGGAIYSGGLATNLSVTNSTFSGNSVHGGSTAEGGAIYADTNFSVLSSTISGNSAVVDSGTNALGGGIYHAGADDTGTVVNTIIAGNTAHSGDANCSGPDFNADFSHNNLIDVDDFSCHTGVGGFTPSTSINLGTLGNYGGPTQTIPLLAGSSAIDGNFDGFGSCPDAADQRGVTRPVGTYCDIGAFEYDPVPQVDMSKSSPADGITLPTGISSLQVAFSTAVRNVGSGDPNWASSALNPANYLLVEAGVNGAFDTLTCKAGLVADDTQVVINSVSYTAPIATLTVNGGVPLPSGNYMLFVCGTTSITDLFGLKLNYGKDAMLRFRISIPAPVVAAPAAAAAAVLPATGFAPDRVTVLPPQTMSYADLGDLWLEIPKLGVQMAIVGVPQADGKWDVSWLGNDAGWLNGSAFPTWAGNSVLTGHVWNADNTAGPFAYLNQLWYGDKVIVHAWGGQYVYEVRGVQQVGPGSTAAMMKHEELPWVTLVTCRGYDEASNSYKYRVLVRAVLVEVK